MSEPLKIGSIVEWSRSPRQFDGPAEMNLFRIVQESAPHSAPPHERLFTIARVKRSAQREALEYFLHRTLFDAVAWQAMAVTIEKAFADIGEPIEFWENRERYVAVPYSELVEWKAGK